MIKKLKFLGILTVLSLTSIMMTGCWGCLIRAEKPVIYLYPEKTTQISVSIDMDGKLSCTYPEYCAGYCYSCFYDMEASG